MNDLPCDNKKQNDKVKKLKTIFDIITYKYMSYTLKIKRSIILSLCLSIHILFFVLYILFTNFLEL